MWPVGTIVVCINAKGLSIPSKFDKPLEENEYYTVREMRQAPRGIWGVRLNEIHGIVHDRLNEEYAFKAKRFRIAESTHNEKDLYACSGISQPQDQDNYITPNPSH